MISVWEKESFFARQDVIILGSGFTGLWAAYHLKKKNPRLKITIVERGLIPSGASTRNAGFACFGSLSEVVYDARTLGQDRTLELVEMRFQGLEKIRKIFPKGIDFELCGGYELYDHQQPGSDDIDNHIRYINSLLKPITGKHQTYKRIDGQISDFGFGDTRHLVKNKLEGYLHSGKLAQALISEVSGMGVQILTGMNIRNYETSSEGVILHLETPQAGIDELQASQLLLCTNAFTSRIWKDADIVPARGQVLLTSPIENLPWKGTFHSDEGFYYFRNLGNRVLLGGARNKAFEEERTTETAVSELIQSTLEDYLDRVVLPGFRGDYYIENRWAGIMAMGSEKRPLIQQVEPCVYAAVRMSGMGVALAPIAARKIAQLMSESL